MKKRFKTPLCKWCLFILVLLIAVAFYVNNLLNKNNLASFNDRDTMSLHFYLEKTGNKTLQANEYDQPVLEVKEEKAGVVEILIKADDKLNAKLTVAEIHNKTKDFLNTIKKDKEVQKLKSIKLGFYIGIVDEKINVNMVEVLAMTFKIDTLKQNDFSKSSKLQTLADVYYLHDFLKKN